MRRLPWALLALATACSQRAEAPPPAATPSPPAAHPALASPAPSPTPVPTARPIVWVALEGDHAVVKVDVGRRRVLRRYEVSGAPHNITVGRRVVAATLPSAGRLAIIEGPGVTEVDLGGSPHDVKPVGNHLRFLVANEGSARLEVLSLSGDRLGQIPLAANPHDLAISRDLHVWASLGGTDELAVFDLRRPEVLRSRRRIFRYIPTGVRPHDLLFAPDRRLWVTDWGGSLHVFRPNGRLVRTIPLGVEAHHLAFTPDGREAWITDHGAHKVFVVAIRSFEVLAEIPIDGAPHHVAITADGRWAAVADHDHGTLVVYRVATRRRVAEIPVGAGPHGVWAA